MANPFILFLREIDPLNGVGQPKPKIRSTYKYSTKMAGSQKRFFAIKSCRIDETPRRISMSEFGKSIRKVLLDLLVNKRHRELHICHSILKGLHIPT